MLIPNDDSVIEEGIGLCLQYVRDFFELTFPELTAEQDIRLSDDDLLTIYTLSKSDDDFVNRLAIQWGINIDAEAIELDNPK